MKNTLLHFLLVFLLFGCHFQTKAQGNLTFVGPVHYTCDFVAPWHINNQNQRVPIDTIVVPIGHVVKLESDNILQVITNTGFLDSDASTKGAIDLKISGISKAIILNYMPDRDQSFPMWLGPGVHYLYFSNNTGTQYSARYSLHGLLFQIQ